MKISVVIPAYNEEKYIGKTLESIKKLDPGEHKLEILVIDGDSTDKTAQIAKSHGAIVHHEPHRGIGFARQHGIKHAKGEIIAFTDADTIVSKDWLLRHIAILNKPGVVLSLGVFSLYDSSFPYYQFMNYFLAPVMWISNKVFKVPMAVGQNMAFWKQRGLDIGGFNQDLKLAEDFDFAVRMKRVGKVVFSYNLCVESSGRRSQEGWKFFSRNIRLFTKYFFGDRKLSKFPDYR